MKKITQKELKKLLHYNPSTGIFTWNVYRRGKVKPGIIAGYFDESTGYIKIEINQVCYYCSRLSWLYMKGYFPEHEMDHKDRNKINNKWCNLRHVTSSCNKRNTKVSSSNTSGVKGVSLHTQNQNWTAYININYRRKYLGAFKNFIDAVRARWEAEIKYNFPNCITTSSAYLYLKEEKKLKKLNRRRS